LTEGIAPLRVTGQVGRQVAYSSDLGRLLGLGGERRKRRTAMSHDDRLRSTGVPATPGALRTGELVSVR
jgi:hypothetical protein